MSTANIWDNISDIHGAFDPGTPEELWFAALCYFQWCADNPLYEGQIVKYPLRHVLAAVPKMRAMTLNSFFVHSGLSATTFDMCRSKWPRVCEIIETIIFDQKFSGAAAGLLKEALIAKDLNMADRVDHTSSDGSLGSVDASLVAELTKRLTE